MMESERCLDVLGLVDLHWTGSNELKLPDLQGLDLVLLGGDLTNYGDLAKTRRLLAPFLDAVPRVLAVCGNTDRLESEELLAELGIALDRRAVEIAGVRFVGLSGGLPFGGCPYERSEEDFARACRTALDAANAITGAGSTVLLTHQPPYGTRCDWTRGRHAGSHAVRAFVEELKPDLVLCGHIHEARGCDQLGPSMVLNPGPWMRGHLVRFTIEKGKVQGLP